MPVKLRRSQIAATHHTHRTPTKTGHITNVPNQDSTVSFNAPANNASGKPTSITNDATGTANTFATIPIAAGNPKTKTTAGVTPICAEIVVPINSASHRGPGIVRDSGPDKTHKPAVAPTDM